MTDRVGYVVAVVHALRALGFAMRPDDIVDDQWRRSNPCAAAIYHRALARSLPWWRPFWKMREYLLAAQWHALCSVVDRDQANEIAETVVRKVRASKRSRQRTLRIAREDSNAGALPKKGDDDR
jgi:hypothetical protein